MKKSGPNSLLTNRSSNSSIICIDEFVSEIFVGCFGDILFGLMLEFVVRLDDFPHAWDPFERIILRTILY